MWRHNREKCQLRRASKKTILDEIIIEHSDPVDVELSFGVIPPEEWQAAVQGRDVRKAKHVYLYRNDPDLFTDDEIIYGGDVYEVVGDMEHYHLMRKAIIVWRRYV